MASFQDRVIGAIRLQASTFEEVEHDTTALPQAAMVVLAAGVAGAIGAMGSFGSGYFSVVALVMSVIMSLIGWAIGAAVVWIVGTRLLPGKNTQADFQEVLRTVGFAQAAGIFAILGIIPFFGWIVRFVVSIWVLVALVIAVRQALDYEDTMKAVIVCVVAWAIMLVTMLLVSLLGVGAAVAGGSMMP